MCFVQLNASHAQVNLPATRRKSCCIPPGDTRRARRVYFESLVMRAVSTSMMGSWRRKQVTLRSAGCVPTQIPDPAFVAARLDLRSPSTPFSLALRRRPLLSFALPVGLPTSQRLSPSSLFRSGSVIDPLKSIFLETASPHLLRHSRNYQHQHVTTLPSRRLAVGGHSPGTRW